MKSVDQQGGERVTVTYHVPPPLLVPDPGPYMWGDYTEKTPTNLHACSHTLHTHTQDHTHTQSHTHTRTLTHTLTHTALKI